MKKLILLLLSGIFLSFCSRVDVKSPKDSFFIRVSLSPSNERNRKDYIKLWINDSLLFKGPYFTNYIEETGENLGDVWGMKVATLIKKSNEDSIKIAIRVIALDNQLFAGRKAIDTTFKYRIDNIPGIAISYRQVVGHFNVFDTINAPGYWRIE